jgi:hypothetical protein
MTVDIKIIKNSADGNGTQHLFPYGFKIFADGDLDVIIRSATGTETVKALDTDYIVTNAGNDTGGNVLFKYNTGNTGDAHYSATDKRPQSGETVILRRGLDITQATDYVANDPFPAESHEDALDRLTLISQELQESIDRSIKISRTNTMTSTEFTVGASDRANKILAFDSSGEIQVTQELGIFQGTDATITTQAYAVRDIIKSTTAAQLNNVYICVATSVVGDLLTDTDHFELLVDAVSAATNAAAAAADAALTAADVISTNADVVSTNADVVSTNADVVTTNSNVTDAQAAQAAAEAAQAAAETALDTFDDRFLGAAATDPALDNDGNALLDGALYFDTTNDIMKVYDLTNTQWRQLTLTSANQTNVNTVAGEISPTNNISTVAGVSSDISTLSAVTSDIQSLADIEDGTTATDAISNVGNNVSDVSTVAGQISPTNNIATVASVDADITTVAGQISPTNNIATVAGDSADIGTVAGLSADIQALADIEDGTTATNAISNVGNNITNVNTVASNLASVNNFGEVYRISSSAPTTSLDVGDLYFDTTSDTLKVYGTSGWQNAGSSINGTSQRYHYDITGTPTSVTGADANGNTLAYDAGYVDVYVNGVRMSDADVTVTSGDTVTFAEALANGDEVDIVGYGTFSVASLNADNLDSGTVPSARVSGAYTGITGTGTLNAGSITSGFGNIDTGSSTITTTGVGTFGSLDISGDIDVDGTTNLDVVDIDGAVDMATTLTVAGNVDFNGDLDVDGTTNLDNTDIDGNLDVTGASNSTATYIKPQGALPDNNDNAGLYVLHQGTAGTGLRVRTDNALTGSNFAHILVNNASASINAFQVSQYGSGLIAKFDKSGTTAMQIDNSGAVTKPLQPAFSASVGSIQTNPANASRVTFSTEIFDQNADYDPSIYVFTAPVTGKYFLSFSIRIDAPDTAADYVRFNLATSNRGYNSSIFDLGGLSGDPNYWNMQTAVLADMDANDTAEVEFIFAYGAQQTDISPESFFTGYLVC